MMIPTPCRALLMVLIRTDPLQPDRPQTLGAPALLLLRRMHELSLLKIRTPPMELHGEVLQPILTLVVFHAESLNVVIDEAGVDDIGWWTAWLGHDFGHVAAVEVVLDDVASTSTRCWM
jgi:hypothetical protein